MKAITLDKEEIIKFYNAFVNSILSDCYGKIEIESDLYDSTDISYTKINNQSSLELVRSLVHGIQLKNLRYTTMSRKGIYELKKGGFKTCDSLTFSGRRNSFLGGFFISHDDYYMPDKSKWNIIETSMPELNL
jgi:hypothetical protein